MRFVGVDIASELHVAAVVDEDGKALVKSLPFAEDAEGYSKLLGMIGASENVLVAMEATGHYWRNLFAYLTARGYAVAVLNPLRTHRFAGEDLARTKTDALDALCLARFALQKRPTAARLPDKALEGLREWVRLRDRFMQDFTDKVRQLHRLLDLGFPEFTRHIKTLDSDLATSILAKYPTAKAFQQLKVRQLASLRYDGRHFVGKELATTLIEAARTSSTPGSRLTTSDCWPWARSPRWLWWHACANSCTPSTPLPRAASPSSSLLPPLPLPAGGSGANDRLTGHHGISSHLYPMLSWDPRLPIQ